MAHNWLEVEPTQKFYILKEHSFFLPKNWGDSWTIDSLGSHKLQGSAGHVDSTDRLGFYKTDRLPPCPPLTPKLGSRQPKLRGQWVTQTLPVFLATITKGWKQPGPGFMA